ncbi:MAG: DUF4159 domain-containing protein [Pirellulaceae bacterium]|nr:DUF4159 domain-containing protein [Pirellulaceae bacterium]
MIFLLTGLLLAGGRSLLRRADANGALTTVNRLIPPKSPSVHRSGNNSEVRSEASGSNQEGRARGFRRQQPQMPTDQPRNSGWRKKRLPSRNEFPTWQIKPGFDQDVFTFVRVQYDSYGPFGWWDRWDNDYPDGDWNFSYRLQQLTSLKVAPKSKVMRLTNPELFDHPFIYFAGVQRITFNRPEQTALRRYLLNGGFMMMDDFWATEGWENVQREMKKVFPGRQPTELTLRHPIFHCVYDLKELPQVVDLKTWTDGFDFEHLHSYSSGDQKPHFWGYFDDNQRLIALLCHNNDLGDGWEREGENRAYFEEYSEKKSYPMGINIVTYAMTH